MSIGIEILDATTTLSIGKTPAVILEGVEAVGSPLVVKEKPPKKYKA